MSDYLASLNLSEEAYKKQHVESTALKRLQGELILNKLSELEKIEITDEQMQKEVEQVMSRFQAEDVLERLKELYVPGSKYFEELRRRVGFKKLIESFFTEAK